MQWGVRLALCRPAPPCVLKCQSQSAPLSEGCKRRRLIHGGVAAATRQTRDSSRWLGRARNVAGRRATNCRDQRHCWQSQAAEKLKITVSDSVAGRGGRLRQGFAGASLPIGRAIHAPALTPQLINPITPHTHAPGAVCERVGEVERRAPPSHLPLESY